jgi:ubiquitin C-terminal hydrolase
MLELILTPRVYLETDHINAKVAKRQSGGVMNRRHFSELLMDEGIDETEFRGLVNEGTTCYMNSLLQTMYILKGFRRAIFDMDTKESDSLSIPLCLQRIFYDL